MLVVRVFACWWFVSRCLMLFVVCNVLRDVCCSSFVVRCPLFVGCRLSLFVGGVCCLLFGVVCWSMWLVVCCCV